MHLFMKQNQCLESLLFDTENILALFSFLKCCNFLVSFLTNVLNKRPSASTIYRFTIVLIFALLRNSCKGQEDVSSSELERIKSGIDVPEGRFPYMCSIRRRGDGTHVCGGVLIDKNWVMTAAHCLDPKKEPSAGMSPFIYCNIIKRDDQDDSKRFTTERCYLHHLWSGHVLNGSDIGLCELDKSADLPIPDLANVGEAFTKDDAFSIIGWGETSSTSSLTDVLQIGLRVGFVSRSLCNRVPIFDGRINEAMICAGRGSANTCKGDSGGPLLVAHNPISRDQVDNPLLDLIVGITSFGTPDCDENAPGVYTRVSCYREWINCIMQKEEEQDCNIENQCLEESSSLCAGILKSLNFDEADALHRIDAAIQSDDSVSVKQILCEGLDSNAKFSDFQNSLLMRAAQSDAVESAKVLLEHGARIEYRNTKGQAALSIATSHGSANATQLLINSEAKIESGDNRRWTALYYAARFNHSRIAQILIENGANVDSRTDVGWTPLHPAAYHNYLAVAKVLIAANATVNIKNVRQFTPLHLAAKKDSIEVAKVLISNNADIEARQINGEAPLANAAASGSLRVLQLLLENEAEVDSMNRKGRTPLYWASFHGHVSIVSALIHNGASKEKTDVDGKKPFDVICGHHPLPRTCTEDVKNALRQLLMP